MKIRTQVSISLIIFAILVLLVIFSVYSCNNQLQEMDRKQQIINEIETGSFELYYLENDYFLHGGERPVKQWNSKYDELSGEIKELKITDPDQQAVFNRLSDSFTELQPTFSNFVTISESVQAEESIGPNQKLNEFAWSMLADQTQMVMFKSSELSQLVKTESLAVQQRNTLVISFSIALLIVFVLFNYFVINRSVLRSISTLHKGTERIELGDPDVKIETISSDELGDLSLAFNKMSSSLKTMQILLRTSNVELTQENAKRKQVEEQLKQFNEELESQVSSRTADLERINAVLGTEVIQRTLAEESIQQSLIERELLLREIHHRVKNNLQIILSLINLQSRNIKDPYLLDTMGDFKNRIMAMAHVHERMCLVDDISRIDLSEIVTFLGTNLFRSYKVDPHLIRLNVEIKDLQITIDSAIPISLILNELMTNSIKHAFPDGTPGEIIVTGRRESGMLILSVRDTGIGIPKEFDWMSSKQSLGHRLVVNLVEQLNGTIELDQTTGTAFNIVVKEKE